MRKIIYFFLLLPIISCTGNSDFKQTDFHSIKIINKNFEESIVIDDTETLESIKLILKNADKIKYDNKMSITFQYTLDFECSNHSGRWLYSTNGYLAKLNYFLKPCYKIENPGDLNILLKVSK